MISSGENIQFQNGRLMEGKPRSERNLLILDSFVHIVSFMAFQTFPVGCSDDQVRPADGMGPVTVRTGWDGSRLEFPQFASDDLGVNLFDPGVTFGAGCGDIPGRNRRSCVGVGKDKMVAVTVVASGGDDQTLLEQSCAVYTLGIIG